MRQFAAPSLRLWNLAREAKVIYTFFCALSLAAVFSSLLLYEDLVGPTLSSHHLTRVRAYYGNSAFEDAAPAELPSPSRSAAGPSIELPTELAESEPLAPEPALRRLTVTIPYRKLLEITHFHLFTVPVFLLILTHLFMLTALSARWKLFWIAAAWATGSLHIFAPWLVRAFPVRMALLYSVSGTGFLVTTLVVCLYPLVIMWRPPTRAAQKLGPSAAVS